MAPDLTVHHFHSLPSLGGLYGQALGRQVSALIQRGSKPQALPSVMYEVGGVKIDPALLTNYQHLLGEVARDELPAGFVHVTAFPLAMAIMARSDFPLPLLGMVHISNRVTQTQELHLGSQIMVRAWAENLQAHRRGTQVDLVVEANDADGGNWRGVSTYLARGVRIPGLEQAPEADQFSGEFPTPTAQWSLPSDIGRRYAKVSGDINPIHTSAVGAKAFGFPRAIAHGMYTASRALAEVGARGTLEWTVDFAAPVLLPSRVNLAISQDGDYLGWGKKLNFTGTVKPA